MSRESDDPSRLGSAAGAASSSSSDPDRDTAAYAAATTATAAGTDEGAGTNTNAAAATSLEASPAARCKQLNRKPWGEIDEGVDSGDDETGNADFRANLREAKQGKTDAIIAVAEAYFYSRGVTCDMKRAFKWYRRAAALRDARGFAGLGTMYEHGAFVEQDMMRARENYLVAARNDPLTQYMLQELLDRLIQEGADATQLYTSEVLETIFQGELSMNMNVDVMLTLADAYWSDNTAQPNYERAAYWYREATYPPHCNPNGYFGLGRCYEFGRGQRMDPAMARECYEQAMGLGHEEARSRYNALQQGTPKR